MRVRKIKFCSGFIARKNRVGPKMVYFFKFELFEFEKYPHTAQNFNF